MAKSAYVRFEGRNHLAINHLSPLDNTDGGLNFYADKASDTVIAQLSSAGVFKLDAISELTAGSGVTIDGVLVKDGGVLLANNINLQAKNSSGTAQDILKIGADNALTLSSLWNTAAVRTSLGLAIGTNVQAYDAQLADVAGLTPTDNGVIIGNGSNFVVESGATLRSSLGLGSIATQASDNVSITGGTISLTDFTAGSTGAYYLGAENTDSSWRITRAGAGTGLRIERRVSGSWTTIIAVSSAPSAYTVTNGSTDRTLNVTGDNLAQVAACLGTLITDLQNRGWIG